MWNIDVAVRPGSRWRRQDRHRVVAGPHGYAVIICDGHGHDECAADEALRVLADGEHYPSFDDGIIAHIRERCARAHEATKECESGTTALLAYIFNDGNVVAGVLGDSILVIGHTDQSYVVSPHHNVGTNADERQAALKRGATYDDGYIRVGDQGLQLSRALGDKDFDHVLNREPELFAHKHTQTAWIALMSDGVVDSADPNFFGGVDIMREMIEAGSTAQEIVDYFFPFKEDDATLVLMRFA